MTLTSPPIGVVVLISGRGSNLGSLLSASRETGAPFRVSAVISNRADAAGLELAANAGVATETLDHRSFARREEFDMALGDLVSRFEPKLVALAGFMRVLTPVFINPLLGRLLNIHPSLLPKYRGLDTHARALANGDSVHGVSVHFVTPELDAGPVVAQARVPVRAGDTPDSLAARVLVQEHRLYPAVVRWYAAGRVRLQDGKVLFDSKPLATPMIL